jgi:hypothetical protein
VSALLAAAPALPLHEAGKYVAGAYVVLVAVVLIYVAIMATRLRRMQRQLGELNAALELRSTGEAEHSATARARGQDEPPAASPGEREGPGA